jgi:plasmid stabilization system protein ParE
MAQIEVVFHELAAKEYRSARRWYRKRSPAAAEKFRIAMDEVVVQIAETPEQGVGFRKRYRWLRTRRFPYVVFTRSQAARPPRFTLLRTDVVD